MSTPSPATGRARVRRHAVVGLCGLAAAAAFASSFLVRATVFPYGSGNQDEPVYQMQGDTYASGRLTLTMPPEERPFFQPWLTGVRGDEVFFVFPPGWPGVLAAADRTMGGGFALAFTAALGVCGVAALAFELTRKGAVAVLAAALFALAPILVVQGALYLSYAFTFACGCWFATALLRGRRTSSRALLVAAGALLGAIFATRPFDAGLWALPVLGFAAWSARASLRRFAAQLGWVAAGLVPLVIAVLAYNAVVTGRPLEFPITAAEPLNQFGFGPRRISPTAEPLDYTLSVAFEAAGRNFAAVPAWVFGGFAGLVLALAGAVVRRRDPASALLLGVAAVFPLGYLAYWGIVLMGDGARGIGPQYYLPLWAPITIFGAAALLALWERARPFALVAAALLVALTIPNLVDKIRGNLRFTENRRSWDEALDAGALRDALVFVPTGSDPYLLTNLSFARNSPDLTGPVLYAADLGARNVALVAGRPDRAPFLLTELLDRGGNPFSGDDTRRVRIPLELVAAPVVEATATIHNDTDRRVVTAYLDGPCGRQERVLDEDSVRGQRYEVQWRLDAAACPRPEPAPLAAGVELGDSADVDVDAGSTERFESRTGYQTSGAEARVLAPGVPYHRVLFPSTAFWVREDVDAVVRVSFRPGA